MSEMLTLSRAHPSMQFSIHPAAHSAYEWVHAYAKLISWPKVPPNLAGLLLQQPLQGVMLYQQKRAKTKTAPFLFQLYAPLWPAMHWADIHPPTGTLLIHNTSSYFPSDEFIEEQAWASALSLLFLSVNTGELAMFREYCQSFIPPNVALKILGKSQVTDADLCKWTGYNRSTLVQQRRRAKTSTVEKQPAQDPFELLSSSWSPNND